MKLKDLKPKLTTIHQKKAFNLIANAYKHRNIILSKQQQQYVLSGGIGFKALITGLLLALANAPTPTARNAAAEQIQQAMKNPANSAHLPTVSTEIIPQFATQTFQPTTTLTSCAGATAGQACAAFDVKQMEEATKTPKAKQLMDEYKVALGKQLETDIEAKSKYLRAELEETLTEIKEDEQKLAIGKAPGYKIKRINKSINASQKYIDHLETKITQNLKQKENSKQMVDNMDYTTNSIVVQTGIDMGDFNEYMSAVLGNVDGLNDSAIRSKFVKEECTQKEFQTKHMVQTKRLSDEFVNKLIITDRSLASSSFDKDKINVAIEKALPSFNLAMEKFEKVLDIIPESESDLKTHLTAKDWKSAITYSKDKNYDLLQEELEKLQTITKLFKPKGYVAIGEDANVGRLLLAGDVSVRIWGKFGGPEHVPTKMGTADSAGVEGIGAFHLDDEDTQSNKFWAFNVAVNPDEDTGTRIIPLPAQYKDGRLFSALEARTVEKVAKIYGERFANLLGHDRVDSGVAFNPTNTVHAGNINREHTSGSAVFLVQMKNLQSKIETSVSDTMRNLRYYLRSSTFSSKSTE